MIHIHVEKPVEDVDNEFLGLGRSTSVGRKQRAADGRKQYV